MRIWLSRPHMGGTEKKYVEDAFESGFIAPLGPQLESFERRIQKYLGDNVYCLGVSSGTAALHLALRCSDIGDADEVWVSSMTFAGGVFPIVYERAKPVFVDLSEDSWTISPDLLAEALAKANRDNRLPKAIIPTDLYGQSCDLDHLENLTGNYGVKLIVDSAESLGSKYNNRMAGTGGDCAILSFNGNKIITTGGGGMLVSRDKTIIEKSFYLATQAKAPAPHYEHTEIGYNYRMGNVPAAIGLGQLEVLDDRVKKRRAIFERYKSALSSLDGVDFMPEPEWSTSTHWLSVLTICPKTCGVTREAVRDMLARQEIESRPVWKPMHMQPVFAGCRYIGRGFDTQLFENGLCLPSGSDLTDSEQDEVIDRISNLLN